MEYEYVSAPREYEGLAQASSTDAPEANGDAQPNAAHTGFVAAGSGAEDQPSTGEPCAQPLASTCYAATDESKHRWAGPGFVQSRRA